MAGYHLLIVEARFYEAISDALAHGAIEALNRAGASFDRESVPGALEIPGAIAMAAAANPAKYAGYVALGCVIRGETSHYDLVSEESARALMDLTIHDRLAIGNGIITVEDEAQAWARANADEKDKGGGAAEAALAMIDLRAKFAAG